MVTGDEPPAGKQRGDRRAPSHRVWTPSRLPAFMRMAFDAPGPREETCLILCTQTKPRGTAPASRSPRVAGRTAGFCFAKFPWVNLSAGLPKDRRQRLLLSQGPWDAGIQAVAPDRRRPLRNSPSTAGGLRRTAPC